MDTWNTITRLHSGDASLGTMQVLCEVTRKLGSTYYDDIHPFLLGLDERSQQNPQSFERVLKLFALHKMEEALEGNLDTTYFVQSLPLQTLVRLLKALDTCDGKSAYAITLAAYKVQLFFSQSIDLNFLGRKEPSILLPFVQQLLNSETPQQVAGQLVKFKVDLCLEPKFLAPNLLESEAENLHSLFVFMQLLLASPTPHELTKVLAINKIQALKRGDLEVTVRQFWGLHLDVDTLVSFVEILLTSRSSTEFVDHLFNAEQDRLCTLIGNENSSDKRFLETQVLDLRASEELLKKFIRIKSCSGLLSIIKPQDVTEQTLEALIQPFDKVPTLSEVKTYVLETKLTAKIPVSHDNHQLACDHPDIFVYDPLRCSLAAGLRRTLEKYFMCGGTMTMRSIKELLHPGEINTQNLHFQPCVTYQEETGEYHTDPLGSHLDIQCEEDKVKIFVFSVNVCRLIKTFDVFHRIPLLQPIELKNSPNCVVTLTVDGQIQKTINTACGTFSVETFYSIYEKVMNIEANLQPFIIHAVEYPSKPTSTKPKGASTTVGSAAAPDDDFVCPEWVTVTLAPVGDQRYATNELELFVAAVSTLFALAGLHELGIAHRDVRWANVVFNPLTNAWLLIDLEFAADFGTPYPHGVVLSEDPVDETCSAKSDVFMVGTMLLKTPFCQDHPEMFPRISTWARHLTEKDLDKRPATERALQVILENPPPSANKESVLDERPVLAALLDFDPDNGIFCLKRNPEGNDYNGDASVNSMPEDEEASDAGEIRSTTDDVEEEAVEKGKDEEAEEKVLSAPRKGNKNHTGKQAPISPLKKKKSSSSSSSSSCSSPLSSASSFRPKKSKKGT
ncbi:hypothetical protein Pelo_17607 [Pelomyxa schiedti]|nr:hypothetical protein Pelo_17607 [Pelomyxa schiedti]